MIVISPNTIDIASTNVAANTEPEWVVGTTYGVNDLVQVTTSSPNKVYKSLRGNNTGREPADSLDPVVVTGTSVTSRAVGTASTTFTTQSGLGFSAGMVVKITKTTTPNTVHMSAEVTAYDSGTGLLSVTIYSTTGAGTHDNWTITSDDEVGFWEEVESTEQWKMFDEYVNQGTTNLDTIDVKVNVTRADHIAIYGMDAATLDLYLWNEAETELLWSTSVDLIYGSTIVQTILDWFEYFFGEYKRQEDYATQFGALAYAGVLRIVLTANPGEYASCGNIIVGRGYNIGNSQYGAKIGMVDYSEWETDDTGKASVTQGYWAKRNNITTYLDNDKLDNIYSILVSLRGVPTAWLGNNDDSNYESLRVFGIFTDFDIVVSGPSHSLCDIEIEGLI